MVNFNLNRSLVFFFKSFYTKLTKMRRQRLRLAGCGKIAKGLFYGSNSTHTKTMTTIGVDAVASFMTMPKDSTRMFWAYIEKENSDSIKRINALFIATLTIGFI